MRSSSGSVSGKANVKVRAREYIASNFLLIKSDGTTSLINIDDFDDENKIKEILEGSLININQTISTSSNPKSLALSYGEAVMEADLGAGISEGDKLQYLYPVQVNKKIKYLQDKKLQIEYRKQLQTYFEENVHSNLASESKHFGQLLEPTQNHVAYASVFALTNKDVLKLLQKRARGERLSDVENKKIENEITRGNKLTEKDVSIFTATGDDGGSAKGLGKRKVKRTFWQSVGDGFKLFFKGYDKTDTAEKKGWGNVRRAFMNLIPFVKVAPTADLKGFKKFAFYLPYAVSRAATFAGIAVAGFFTAPVSGPALAIGAGSIGAAYAGRKLIDSIIAYREKKSAPTVASAISTPSVGLDNQVSLVADQIVNEERRLVMSSEMPIMLTTDPALDTGFHPIMPTESPSEKSPVASLNTNNPLISIPPSSIDLPLSRADSLITMSLEGAMNKYHTFFVQNSDNTYTLHNRSRVISNITDPKSYVLPGGKPIPTIQVSQ